MVSPIKVESREDLERFGQALAALMREHDVGGAVFVVSKDAAAWAHALPPWAAIGPHPKGGGWIVQLRGSTPAGLEKTEATMHFLGVMRDLSNDCLNLFGRLFRLAAEQIKLTGGELVHTPFARGGERPDPFGGKGS